MKLIKIRIHNFLSIGDAIIPLSKFEGISVIQGVNRDSNPISSNGCHAKGQKVLMYSGDFKKVENIKIGDILMGPDSTPRTVLNLFRGRGKMYKIVPKRGKSFIVNEDHILSLYYNDYYFKPRIVNISVKDYLKESRYFKWSSRLYKSSSIDFPKHDDKLLLDPYYLGLVLGDGSIISGVNITTMDKEIKEYFCNYSLSLFENLYITEHTKKDNKASTYSVSSKTSSRSAPNPVLEIFKELGLKGTTSGDKFIPKQYKVSSRENRLQILAGLLDTDGYYKRTTYEYVSKSAKLAEDVAFIARSLGLKVTERIKNINNIPYYRLFISGNTDIIPCKIPRKKANKRKINKNHLVEGFSIEELEEDNYYGFELDKDNLYLLDNFTVTHNSGKSAIIEAIVFAFFGRTIRKTRESSIIRNGAKSCLVCLNVDFGGDQVYIERGRKPSKLILTINGKDRSRESALETQKYLEKYLNIDFTTFTTAIMFGQRNSANFITANPSDKRKILQTFLGIDEYFAIRDNINAKKRSVKKLQDIATGAYKTFKADLEDIESKIKLELEKQGLEDIPHAEDILEEWKTIKDAIKDKESLSKRIERAKKDRENVLHNCPECGQEIQEDKIKELIEKHTEIESKLKTELDNIEIPEEPKHTENEIKNYLAKKRFDTGLDVLETMREQKLKSLEDEEEKANSLALQYRELQYWEMAFSEQGIIKYIINNIIEFFNNRASYYLSLLTNGHLTILFDQQLSEVIYSGKSKVEYNAMSGGESKKVQIAVMLALHDLLKFNGKVTPNFLFMDEITEIDRPGLRSISSLMQLLTSKLDKKVVLITHNSDLLSELKIDTTVTVEKRKGKSKIKVKKNG